MTLDSLPDSDTSGLCLVKTISTAPTCWPYRNTALRDDDRTSTRTSSVAKGTASIAIRERKTSVLRACRVPNPANRLNVVQRPKTLVEPQRSMTSRSYDPSSAAGHRTLDRSEAGRARPERRYRCRPHVANHALVTDSCLLFLA